MFGDLVFIVIAATGATAAIMFAIKRHGRERRERIDALRPEPVTPVERPCLLPANAPLAERLNELRYTLEATPRAIGDIERTIRLSAERVTDGQVERIAVVFDDLSAAAKRGAVEVRETKGAKA